MLAESKTLYIPLYGKSLVSRKGIILQDRKAEEIWEKEGFPLHGKPKSRWLAYYMGMRAAVMDQWLCEKLQKYPNAVVLHLGCGLDSRCVRVEHTVPWFDVDMLDVIDVRKSYFTERDDYRMIGSDVTDLTWLSQVPKGAHGLIVMEGLSMYLPMEKLKSLFSALEQHFDHCDLLMDVYTEFGVKASAYKNPIQSVGASVCTGVDDPHTLICGDLRYDRELSMTPEAMTQHLKGFERWFFRKMFAGKFAGRIYRMYGYRKV